MIVDSGGLMGAGADAGFLASAETLMWTLGGVSLVGVDTTLVIHDGTMLYHAFFGSAAPPEDATLERWLTSDPLWYQWQGPNSDAAATAAGADVMNAPGWLAQWQWQSQFFTEAPHGLNFPAPSVGTRVDFYDFDSMDNFYWGDHFYYLLARDIPGSVSTYNPATDQPDYTLPTPALPDRSTAATALNTELARPEYHTLRLELQHLLDPRCSPDPTSSTVPVPTILPDQTPTDYEACLATLGLNGNVSTLSETDTTVANGGVVETVPEQGDTVQPGTTVEIAANPSSAQISEPDDRCDVNNGAGATGATDDPPADGTGYPPYQLVEDSPYPAAIDPSASSPAITDVPLRWGTTGWGRRHILVKHPYTAADKVQTMQALADDTNPTPTRFTAASQWDFHHFYTMPDGGDTGGTVTCVRTVRVEYFVDKKALTAGLDGIRGIQNSYAGLYLGGLPGH
jgi:PASTA domain-containing protein